MDPPSSRPPAMAVSVYQATTRVNPSRSHFYTNKTFLLFAVGCLALGLINLNFSSKLLLPSDKNGTNKSVHHDSSTKAVSAGKDRLKFARFGEEYITPPICTEPRGELCLSPPIAEFSSALHEDDTLYSCAGQCSIHSTCFMGTCLCHPGYTGPTCDEKKKRANPWYTADCPNLAADKLLSYNINDTIGGNKNCTGEGPNPCAYLCYSGEEYGSVIIPQQVWQNAQNEEGKLWRAPRFKKMDGDRVNEHFQGFADYKCIPGESLGNVIEFGAGPWTQFRGLLSKRPDVKVDSYTVLDPGADGYIKSVESCAYKTGKLLKFDRNGFHDFPVHVVSDLAETSLSFETKFDTVMVTNVIEHVQNAVEFLHGLHKSLKPGGLLVFHDRYYYTPLHGDKILVAGGKFHPIRPTKDVFDKFLSYFDILFNNCVGHFTIDGWVKRQQNGERGYYVVARKKDIAIAR